MNKSMKNQKFKVNMHITEKCNYNCGYCFADFGTDGKILSLEDNKKIIDNLADSRIVEEINIAGGEPFCYPCLNELIEYIVEKKMKCSIISNGSLLTKGWIEKYGKKLVTFGFSVDALNKKSCREIGRCCGRFWLQKEDITDFIRLLRSSNPSIQIKVNTVISKHNLDFSVKSLIENVDIDRWKILRVKLFEKGCFSNRQFLVSDKEWNYSLVEIMKTIPLNISMQIVVEETLVSTYIVVDPLGFVKDNSQNDNYISVGNLLTEPFSEVLKRVRLNMVYYKNRYKK